MPDSDQTVISLGEGEVALVFRAKGVQVAMQEGEKETHEVFAIALALLLQDRSFRDMISNWARRPACAGGSFREGICLQRLEAAAIEQDEQ